MSNWVHIAGVIRIGKDTWREAKQKGIVKKIFNRDGYEDMYMSKNYEGLPCGSEGPVTCVISSAQFEHIITIYGDLRSRDLDYVEYIEKWWYNLEKILKKNNMDIKHSILNIIVDRPYKNIVLQHNDIIYKEY